MRLTTGLLNYTGTPGAYTNTFANRPGATAVPTGTLYFSNDTNVLYQTNGASWISYSGGGSLTLANVLNNGNTAINSIELFIGSQSLEYFGNDITNGNVGIFWGASLKELGFRINNASLYGVAIDVNTGVKCTYLGDCQQSGNGTEMWINDNSRTIKTFDNRPIYPQGIGLLINYISRNYSLGDWFGYNDGTYINVDDNAQNFNVYAPANTYINSFNFSLNGNGAANAQIDFNNSAFKSGSAGGNSGQHLVVYVQGVQYKITLLNP